jgi:hypothetical protein
MLLSGGDVKNQDKLQKNIKRQTDAFGKLFATTGLSIDEFKAFNDELLSSESTQIALNGRDQEQRQLYLKAQDDLRQKFVNLGMSAKGAQKALLEIQDVKKSKVTDRFQMGADIITSALRMGMDATKAMRARDHFISGKLDEQDTVFLQAVRKQADTLKTQGTIQQEIIADSVYETLDKIPISKETTREEALQQEARGQITPDDVNRMVEAATTPGWLSDVNSYKDSLKEAVTTPIVTTLLGLGAGALAMSKMSAVAGAASGVASTVAGGVSKAGGGLMNMGKAALPMLAAMGPLGWAAGLAVVGGGLLYNSYQNVKEKRKVQEELAAQNPNNNKNPIATPTSKQPSTIAAQPNKATNSSAVKEQESPSISLTPDSFSPINAPLTSLNSLMERNNLISEKQLLLLETIALSNKESADKLKDVGYSFGDTRINARQALQN